MFCPPKTLPFRFRYIVIRLRYIVNRLCYIAIRFHYIVNRFSYIAIIFHYIAIRLRFIAIRFRYIAIRLRYIVILYWTTLSLDYITLSLDFDTCAGWEQKLLHTIKAVLYIRLELVIKCTCHICITACPLAHTCHTTHTAGKDRCNCTLIRIYNNNKIHNIEMKCIEWIA